MSNADEPAFPTSVQRGQSGNYWTEDEGGLTKRELFAAMALQGILANSAVLERHGLTTEKTATDAVDFADALLAELAK